MYDVPCLNKKKNNVNQLWKMKGKCEEKNAVNSRAFFMEVLGMCTNVSLCMSGFLLNGHFYIQSLQSFYCCVLKKMFVDIIGMWNEKAGKLIT